ncbi:hypothetical protein PV729_09250 [Streptomyces europaeiscabiei]|uniref:Uncharacterized protein n=1 Tax=Streptomyces europaeiscabiei TaxID=146819 RepID=A0ABU4NAU4_9ACTN|nr:hypothetical protein [Streptomyces europaeiscabiei]MDX3541615.1 hypothetical protein [Streptomyces europaeiscabiei]MDX3551956.1 hypothetical protein [Streptomyces europaeiscabiei]MDX3700195.1 hypothetical protein [Streptomyces europaeiscabiei]
MEIDLFRETHDVTAKVSCEARDNETGEVCGKTGRLRKFLSFSMPLCPAHHTEIYSYQEWIRQGVVLELDKEGTLVKESPGCTYAVRMKDGTVKIGKAVRLVQRLQAVSREYNEGYPVEVLAVLDGGRTTELRVHRKWIDLRLTQKTGERHHPTSELMAWIEEQGIHTAHTVSVDIYNEWREKKLADTGRPDMFEDWD